MSHPDHPEEPLAEGKKTKPEEDSFSIDFGPEHESDEQAAAAEPSADTEAADVQPGEGEQLGDLDEIDLQGAGIAGALHDLGGVPSRKEDEPAADMTAAVEDDAFTYDLSHIADAGDVKDESIADEIDLASGDLGESASEEGVTFDLAGADSRDKAVEAGLDLADTGEEGEAEEHGFDWTRADVVPAADEMPASHPTDAMAMDETLSDASQAEFDLGHEAEERGPASAYMQTALAGAPASGAPRAEAETAFDEEEAGLQRPASSRRLSWLVALAAVLIGGGIYLALQSNEPIPAAIQAVPERAPSPPAQVATDETMPGAETATPLVQEPIIEPMPALSAVTAETAETNAQKPLQLAAVTPQTPVQERAARYSLQGGAFIFRSNLEQLQAKLAGMGFTSQVSEGKKTVPMIRLRVGVYPEADAAAKLKEVAAASDAGAFALRKDGGTAIYAGSYFYASSAERAAKQLAAKGIIVEQEATNVTVPMYILQFGAFTTRKEAEAKLAEIKAAGIEAKVTEMTVSR